MTNNNREDISYFENIGKIRLLLLIVTILALGESILGKMPASTILFLLAVAYEISSIIYKKIVPRIRNRSHVLYIDKGILRKSHEYSVTDIASIEVNKKLGSFVVHPVSGERYEYKFPLYEKKEEMIRILDAVAEIRPPIH